MEELKARFAQLYPEVFFLVDDFKKVTTYLSQQGWLLQNEAIVALEKPGEGNMNKVLRVVTNHRSFILKQARPWVEKYPSIDAPVERNGVEARFFSLVNQDPGLCTCSPEVLNTDPENFLMMLSDLGAASDFLFLYHKGEVLETNILQNLVKYLSRLHALPSVAFPENMAMRQLNHEHIFRFPFEEDNGFDLDQIEEGLQKASLPYKQDRALKSKITRLGNLYLEEGPVLIQGDYYPGSWLQTSTGLKIIDPEFSFKGYREFDLGVLIAHLMMARQSFSHIRMVMDLYNHQSEVDLPKVAGFAGTEILRRMIGVAQLPLTISLAEKIDLMRVAANWIQSGKINF